MCVCLHNVQHRTVSRGTEQDHSKKKNEIRQTSCVIVRSLDVICGSGKLAGTFDWHYDMTFAEIGFYLLTTIYYG